jgi:hypothetical protein
MHIADLGVDCFSGPDFAHRMNQPVMDIDSNDKKKMNDMGRRCMHSAGLILGLHISRPFFSCLVMLSRSLNISASRRTRLPTGLMDQVN